MIPASPTIKIQKPDLADWLSGYSGPVRKRAEVWVYNAQKQLLCARNSFVSPTVPGKWQSCLNCEVPENQDYLDPALYLVSRVLNVPREPGRLIALHLRLDALASVFTRVFAFRVNISESGAAQPNADFMEYRWMSLPQIALGIKNREFAHPMDYQVVDFLKNP